MNHDDVLSAFGLSTRPDGVAWPEWARRVSIIVPCRNELAHLPSFCASLVKQDLPEGVSFEVLIADGQSDDGTTQWLQTFCAADPRFAWIDNPQRIVSTGLNRCIAQAKGGVIIRMDVHTVYANDYCAQCIQTLIHTGADNVGGPWRAQGSGHTGQAIAAAFQSRWVAGGARSRDLTHNGWVDTVYLGCWPVSTFGKVGGFDEQLVRNQDDEHNLRLVLSGGRVWQSASIRSMYCPRDSMWQLFQQYRQYGYWKTRVLKKHSRPASWRHLIPAIFVAMLLGLSLLALTGWGWVLVAWYLMVSAYLLYVFACTVAIACALPVRAAVRLPLVILTYHVSYGVGFWEGLLDMLQGKVPSSSKARLTR